MLFERTQLAYRRWEKDGTLRTIWYSVLASFIQLSCGAATGYVTFAIEDINDNKNPFNVSRKEQSWIASVFHLGCIPGGLLSWPLMTYFGRKPVLIIGCLPYAVSWLLIASAPNVQTMYAGRILSGFATGMTYTTSLVYISEIASAGSRGGLMALVGCAMGFGRMLAYVIGDFVAWNWSAVIYVALSLITSTVTLLIPESPRWLLVKSKDKHGVLQTTEAEKILRKIRAEDEVELELEEIRKSISQNVKRAKFTDLFMKKNALQCLCFLFMQVVNAFGGNVVVGQYGVNIFDAAHVSLSSDMQTMVLGAIGVLGPILTLFTMDLIGRRPLAFLSLLLQAFFLSALAAYFYVDEKVDSVWAERYMFWLPLLSLVMFNLIDGWSGAAIVMMASELFPTNLRSITSAISFSWAHACKFLATRYFGELADVLGAYGEFWLCAGINVIGGLFYLILVPEANRKTLEQVQVEIHSDNVNSNKSTSFIDIR